MLALAKENNMTEENVSKQPSDKSGVQIRVSTKGGCSSRWSLLNTAAVVGGFIIWWPVGLFLLFWVLNDRNASEVPKFLERGWSWFQSNKSQADWSFGFGREHSSDNVIFNEYQQTQFDRIHEIREDIRRRKERFEDFRAGGKRRADEEEFKRFMNESPLRAEN